MHYTVSLCQLHSRITHSSNLSVLSHMSQAIHCTPPSLLSMQSLCHTSFSPAFWTCKTAMLGGKKGSRFLPNVTWYYLSQGSNPVEKNVQVYARKFSIKRKPTCHHMKWYPQTDHCLNLLGLKDVNADVSFVRITCIFWNFMQAFSVISCRQMKQVSCSFETFIFLQTRFRNNRCSLYSLYCNCI